MRAKENENGVRDGFEQLSGVYALALDPDDFLRGSGELLARCDAAWKKAKSGGMPVEDAIARFLSAGLAHVEALEMCMLRREALAAMVTMLISIDMSGVATASLGYDYVRLHVRFLAGCACLRRECMSDSYAMPHAEAILSHEAMLFIGAVEAYHATCCHVDLSDGREDVAGLLEGCRRYLDAHPGENADPAAPAEAYVDIFTRLHTINKY